MHPRMQSQEAGIAAFGDLIQQDFCPIVPCEVLAQVRKGQCVWGTAEARAYLESCIEDMPCSYAMDFPVEMWHRRLVYWLMYLEQCLDVSFVWTRKRLETVPIAGSAYDYCKDDLVHHYLCKVNENPGVVCTACHLGASRACTSGIAAQLIQVLPVDSEWRGQELPDVSYFGVFQLRAWSMLVCFLTMGLLGKALGSEEVVAWSQTLLENPAPLIRALRS